MSLNPMSLIGVGRVGLRPNSDNVTNYTLFFLSLPLGNPFYLLFSLEVNVFYCLSEHGWCPDILM